MATCPDGHDSVSEDYCDVCGMLMTGAPGNSGQQPAGVASAGSPASVPSGTPSAAAGVCPACGAAKTPGAFCESCGYNFAKGTLPASSVTSYPASPSTTMVPPVPIPDPVTGPRPVAAAWTAVVAADRAYFDRVKADSGDEAAGIEFPAYVPERRFALAAPEMRIGRRSPSRGLDPEIDLTGPPTDPGISRLHAVLIATPDGGWAVIDPGSANGTQVNGKDIRTGEQVPLHDGDRIALGAWTTITVHNA
jgi:hypothetical protein